MDISLVASTLVTAILLAAPSWLLALTFARTCRLAMQTSETATATLSAEAADLRRQLDAALIELAKHRPNGDPTQ